ncbi:alanine--tRNA ligase [soil metagenome]
MKSAVIRQKFLDYFQKQGHTIVPSSALVPGNDATLLFTNAGMVQFKDVFLGRDQRPYARATSVQRCVRAGGKHNDLENVGYTARHHTFFEMLGNFSFGDYFKREAIHYAWEFLTQELAIPAEKLWVTVFEDDTEAAAIWLQEVKIDPARFSRCGEKDNFWSMGDSGPCGPCTEIFYDHGPSIVGGPPGSADADGDRYVEIWNLVFMQYDRLANGTMLQLPKPSVDTGMGLERIAAVMQGVQNNYDIDIFQILIGAILELSHTIDRHHPSARVIADHIRAAAFMITDGVIPSNEGRGYVLRRIIRRALRHGNKLGLSQPFFYKLVGPLVAEMGEAYPDLVKLRDRIEKVLEHEEEQFAATLEQGLRIFELATATMEGQVITGEVAFRLYDTYGFPLDLTADLARERGFTIDEAGFHVEMEQQRSRSQAASHFTADYHGAETLEDQTQFLGYTQLTEDTSITAILQAGQKVSSLNAEEEGILILEKTPFYAESGGQCGDQGLITLMISDTNEPGIFEVRNTQKRQDAIMHIGILRSGQIKVGDKVQVTVNAERRTATALNHSATHLLNAALHTLLGDHVLQKGSLVEPERLRFDFSHFEALNRQQIQALEQLVNAKIRENLSVETQIMTRDEAMDSGAVALFGEKYGAEVRVLRMGSFSLELCGGTHARRTGDIGVFKIIAESGVAAGVRRIEALTGEYALIFIEQQEDLLQQLSQVLKVTPSSLFEKTEQLCVQNKLLEREVTRLQAKQASHLGDELVQQTMEIAGVNVLVAELEAIDAKGLREVCDQLKNKLGEAVILLAVVSGQKIDLVAVVTPPLTSKIKAGELMNYVATQVGGKGGGRPDMAQGGGNNPKVLEEAMQAGVNWIAERLESV